MVCFRREGFKCLLGKGQEYLKNQLASLVVARLVWFITLHELAKEVKAPSNTPLSIHDKSTHLKDVKSNGIGVVTAMTSFLPRVRLRQLDNKLGLRAIDV